MSPASLKTARCAAVPSSSTSSVMPLVDWWRCRCGVWTERVGRTTMYQGESGLLVRALAALSLALSACGSPSGPAPKPVAAAAPVAPVRDHWAEFADRFIESYFRANPFFAVQAGRHEFDGQMSDWSAAGIAAEVARLHA